MERFLCALIIAKLIDAALALSSSRPPFLNSTTVAATPSSTSSTLLFASSSTDGFQNCTAWPIDYRTGYWWSRPLPTAVVGTVYTIIDDSTNATTLSTSQLDHVTVTRCQPDCNNATSREVWTDNRAAWSWNGTFDIGPPTTTSDSMRLLDGSYTTLIYPNGLFEATDSFYWRGTVTYTQGGRTKTASNIGPSSAPGYVQWKDVIQEFWLPPSPLPDHDEWANMTIDVDPLDPYGHNYVFIHNRDCALDMEYMLDYFHDPAIIAEWNNCMTPVPRCEQVWTWVKTVNYLLDSTTIHTGKKTAAQHGLANENDKSTDEHTVATEPHETKPRTAIQVENTRLSPTQTAAPGSPVPHKTPKETRKTEKTRMPTSGNTRSPHEPHATDTTARGSKPTRTRVSHGGDDGNDSDTNTRGRRPHNTVPADEQSVPAVISIGTEKITRNTNSDYVLSGTTLIPGKTIVVGSGPSAATIAMSTQGAHTVLIVDGKKSTLGLLSHTLSSTGYIIGGETVRPGSSVIISGDTYSIGPRGSTVFINGHPEQITHSGTLDGQTWVTTLSNGILFMETLAPEVRVDAVTTSLQDGRFSKVITEVMTMPALIFGSRTLSAGSQIVISGTTYSLASSMLYVDGKSTTLNLDDDKTVITLPNGMVATEIEATATLLLPANPTSSTIARVSEASNVAARPKSTCSMNMLMAACVVALIR